MSLSRPFRALQRAWTHDETGKRWATRLGALASVATLITFIAAAATGAFGLMNDDDGDEEGSCVPRIEEEAFAEPPVTEHIADYDRSLPDGGVAARTEPCMRGGDDTVLRRYEEGENVLIVCQARAERIMDTTSIWNRLHDGSWLSDFYVEDTRVDEFAPWIPRCDGK